jgi:hypothetical protein
MSGRPAGLLIEKQSKQGKHDKKTCYEQAGLHIFILQ